MTRFIKFSLLILLSLLATAAVRAQAPGLYINEVSQGPSGSKEYVELIVMGAPTCYTIPTLDLRGWYIDDNNGFHATGAGTGIAQGCVRFTQDPLWAAVPIGTLIVIHNDADLNASVPATDLSMSDGNCRLVIPVSNCALLERHTTLPSTAVSTYPATGFTSCGSWTNISMANADDSFQTIDPAGNLFHSVSWGNNTLSTIIYFAGSSAGMVALMTNAVTNNSTTQANWVRVAVGGNESPGSPNNAANQAWICSMNNGCTPLLPISLTGSQTNASCTCTGSATVNASGGFSGCGNPYAYSWAPSGGSAATASGLCAGTYTVTVSDINGCSATRTVTITAATSFTLSTTQTNVSCNGGTNGSASVTVSGGTGPFTYSWAPSGGTGSTATGLPAGTYTVTVTDAAACTGTATVTITQPPALTATQSQVNVLCNGQCTGSATVAASGGTAPYTYAWAPSGGTAAAATGLCPGTYTCTITDANGCPVTRTFTITQPPALTATGSQVNVLCNGGNTGSATIAVSGGTAPYTYSWVPSGGTAATAANLTAGNYTVTVTDANGCVTTRSFTITQPPALTTTGSQVNILCNGTCNGSASVVASGGTAPYTYAWAPSGGTAATASALCAGTYTATVTDANGCIITRTFTITQPPALTTTGSQVNILCNGGNTGSATVVASGGTAPYTYAWAPSGGTGTTATGLSAGNYTVTVTDANGCATTQTFAITQPSVLATTSSQVNVLCNGGNTGSATVTVSGGTAPYTYAWTPSGGTASSATNLTAGSYTVTVTDANGCTIIQTYTITQPPALTASTTTTPATCGSPNGSATVTASGGTAPYSYSWTPAGGTGATATALIAGSYTVTITDANGCTTTATANVANTGGPGATITNSANILCFGGSNGSATVTASGGTAPYTYSWTPSGGTGATATGLIAGSYTVTVTDANGCITTASVTLTEPPALAASATSTPVLCNGGTTGTAGVMASGGTAPYTYSWAPSGGTGSSATGLAAGTYTVTITDASGCTTTATTTVTQPTAIATTTSSTPVLCNGGNTGAASVTVSGGTTPYIYSWSPSGGTGSSASGLTVGTYTITITDANGCVINPTVTITEPAALTASTTTTPATCGNPNGSASVTASGGTAGYTYSWTPLGGTGTTANGLPAGIYTVTITDANGCTSTATASVTNAGGLSATISVSTDVSCFGGNDGSATVAASGGTTPYTYAWTPAGGTGTTGTGLIAGSYTVTVTDANSCTATASVIITQPPALTASSSVTPVLCNGGNSGSANMVASGGTPGYTYNWAPSGGTGASAANLAAATYTCTVMDANGCITTASAIVTEPAALSAAGSQTNVSCNGGTNGTATVTASGGTAPFVYSWAPSGGTGATATGLAAQSYTVTITDANGCTLTQPFSITQPAAVSVTTSTIPATCGSANGSASAVASGGTGAYSYLWTPGNMTSATISNMPAGNYTVTVTDQDGCTGNAAAAINNSNSPVAVLSASSGVSCFGGNNGSASVSASGGTGTLSYSWSNGDTTTATSMLTAGTYTLLVTDQNGCTDSVLVTISEPPQLVLSTAQTDVLCNGGTTGNATASASGGVGPYAYLWSNNDPDSSTTGLTAGPWSVTVTDSNGCTTTAGITITEPPLLALLASGTNVTCFAACDGQLSVAASGGAGGYAYSWNSGCTTASCANTCAGTYTITVTDSNGCVAVDSVTIAEPLQLVASATSTDAHCTQADGSASASAAGGTGNISYQWIGGPASQNYTNIAAGNYSVVVTDQNGCMDTAVVAVNNIPGVIASAGTTTGPACFQGSDGSVFINASGGNGPYVYTWLPNISITDSATGIPAGTYQVTVTDADGCTSVVNVSITQPTDVTLSASAAPASFCAGQGTQLSSLAAGGTPGYSYSWNPGALPGSTQNITPATSGTYTVYVTDANGCSDSATVAVTVNPVPVAGLVADTTSGCAPLCVSFSDLSAVASPATITSWSWDFGDGNTSTSQNPSHCYNTPGVYTIVLNITTGDGCAASFTMASYVDVFSVPVASFTFSPQPANIFDPNIAFTDQSTNAATWSWNFGDPLNSMSTSQDPFFTYEDPGCYNIQLTVTSPGGCVDDTTQEVCIEPEVALYVPNAFTPNGDGSNDFFLPEGVGMEWNTFHMMIFDRWGNLVYETTDINKPWDGRANGGSEIAQIDVYVWKIDVRDINSNMHRLLGHVSLVK